MLSRLSRALKPSAFSTQALASSHRLQNTVNHRNFSSLPEKGSKGRVVLAYSGGLDTSTILCWLIDQGYDVVCFLADIGQPKGDVEELKAKAERCGAVGCHVVNAQKEFVTDFVFPLIRASCKYERRYLMGTSVARPCITRNQVEIAHKENCQFLAHGATGKGNDQVRFELHANYLDPNLKTIAPWRNPEFFNRFEGRQHLLAYAAEKGIPVKQTKAKSYSMDENLLHISYESGILEDLTCAPTDDMFIMTVSPKDAPNTPERIKLHFQNGDPVKLECQDGEFTDPLDLFNQLNIVGGRNGVGRKDLVENRYVGIKSRGVYETPGGTILFDCHTDLETIVMDREVMKIRDQLSNKFVELVYNGFWYSPEMDYVRNALDASQKVVNGWIEAELYKGNVTIKGRGSDNMLYDDKIASMDVAGEYNPQDAGGFIRINGLRLKAAKWNLQKMGLAK